MDNSGSQPTPRSLPVDESTPEQQDVYAKQENLFRAASPEEAGGCRGDAGKHTG